MMSGVDYREVLWGCQADVRLFYFNIIIACFCIVFYKVLRLFSACYQRFFCGDICFSEVYLHHYRVLFEQF